jgi:succinate-semialdehyde dehydrogenase/glutarate-semialdehyde dehydrogenase
MPGETAIAADYPALQLHIDGEWVGDNTTMMAAPDSPFGGVKHSGHGAEDRPEGLDACLVTKAIHQG